jgi:hypothetical protein
MDDDDHGSPGAASTQFLGMTNSLMNTNSPFALALTAVARIAAGRMRIRA